MQDKKYTQKEIARKLYEWYEIDDNTCSGKPHYTVEECDLCFTCFKELCNKFGLNYEDFKVVENAKQ